jgi:hypothetical protein
MSNTPSPNLEYNVGPSITIAPDLTRFDFDALSQLPEGEPDI